MDQQEKQNAVTEPRETLAEKKIHMKVDDCSITLTFPHEPQDSAITEVKRIMLAGHLYKKA